MSTLKEEKIEYVDEEENEIISKRLKKILPEIEEEIKKGEYVTLEELLEEWIKKGLVRRDILSRDEKHQ